MKTTNFLLIIICALLLWIGLTLNRIDLIEPAKADNIQQVDIHSIAGRRLFSGNLPVTVNK